MKTLLLACLFFISTDTAAILLNPMTQSVIIREHKKRDAESHAARGACGIVTDRDTHRYCYALFYQDIDYCRNIGDVTLRQWCFDKLR